MSVREFWQRMGVTRWFLLLLFVWSLAPRLAGTFVNILWFGELGYSQVYWFELAMRVGLFVGFLALTFAMLWGGFKLLAKVFEPFPLGGTTFYWEGRMLNFFPKKFMRPLEWGVALFWSFLIAAAMSVRWMVFALFFNQPSTGNPDPIFGKPEGFYFFSWPLYQIIASWLSGVLVILFLMAALYAFVAYVSRMPQARRDVARRTSYLMASLSLSLVLVVFAWRAWLKRYSEIWHEHDLFAGINYTQAHVILPGLAIISVVLLICALFAVANALWWRRLRWLLVSLLLPMVMYVGMGLGAAYVSNFVVKPNELQKETPYLTHNIKGTRAGFNLDKLEERSFPANSSAKALEFESNKSTFKNVRLWDWNALQATLMQVQALRPYYNIPDVDIDRYKIGDEKQEVMISARELDLNRLPANSRNWVNERLIYTHGYGVVMNTASDITSEGRPKFLLSDMPVKSTVPGLEVKRPEIYFGQQTTTPVYVKTTQKEFDYPREGEGAKGVENVYTTYDGKGGIVLGNFFRKTLLSWAMGDITKVPFSSAITPQSRVLLYRQIQERAYRIAPFLTYDDDPYIVLGKDGRLYWIMDAYTTSSYYPFSTHYQVQNKWVNYIRNSVKVVVDAYDGTTHFYVYDTSDPLVAAYRRVFPSLFRDAAEMPTNLQEHVRYPETLFRTQAQVYSLYHMTDVKVFFGREDAWQIARVSTQGTDAMQMPQPEFNPLGGPSSNLSLGQTSQILPGTRSIDPYYVLIRLPGIDAGQEFVPILPFTPANRDNMIGWLAGRSDGENYGKLVGYNFPKSKLVDGPAQVKARVNQNQYLSQQFTLWNSSNSSILRGNLLVIPMGTGLLYVEPIFLQADQSRIPELRLVVLVTQDSIVYDTTYQGALSKLMKGRMEQVVTTSSVKGKTGTSGKAAPSVSSEEIEKAAKALDAYQRLTAEGKYSEAGKELETLRSTLSKMQSGD